MQSDRFIGPFELRGELGRGSMAVVWRAYDASLDREVAIKEPVLPPESSSDIRAEFAERFVREARAAARLNHPGIVTVYSASLFQGRPQIVMELVDGRTLREVLAGGALTTLQTFALLDQLLAAAGYAHEHGVTHRDLKPDNVFVTKDGLVKLADFGIAQLGRGGPALTRAGTLLGTPAYMAPEQIRGDPVDVRCDVFALGVIAYECLSGANPFGSESSTHYATIIHRIMSEPTPPLAVGDEPAGPLAGVIMRALEKDRALRFDSATTMLSAWRGALSATIDTRAELAMLGAGSGPNAVVAGKSGERRHKTQIWGQPDVEEVDATPPITVASGADDAWHATDVALALAARDSGSGVARTEYRLDGGPWTEGVAPVVAVRPDGSADGEHTLEYRSADLAGNLEPTQRLTVRIRSIQLIVAPVVPVPAEPVPQHSGKRRTLVVVSAIVAIIALVALAAILIGSAVMARGHATSHATSNAPSGPSQATLTTQATTLDKLGAQLDEAWAGYQKVVSSLNAKLAANRVQTKAWNKVSHARLTSYESRLAAVEAYNRSSAAQGTPGHSTPPVYDSYGNLRSAGTYVPGTPGHKEALPSRPTLPAKIRVTVDRQRRQMNILQARLTVLAAQLKAAQVGSEFMSVDSAMQESSAAMLSKVHLALRSLTSAIKHDPERGDILVGARVAALRDRSADKALTAARGLLAGAASAHGVPETALGWARGPK